MNLAALFIRRPVFATMVVAFLVVLGLFSYRALGIDLFPNVDLPVVTVTTTLRGASPEEMEAQVTKPIEEAINTASGIANCRRTPEKPLAPGRSSIRTARRSAASCGEAGGISARNCCSVTFTLACA